MIMVYIRSAQVRNKQTVASLMRSLSDNLSLDLFRLIASASLYPSDNSADKSEPINSQIIISKIKLTRKQYYSRISKLITSGLIRRSNGKYIVTSLGKVVYSVNGLVEQAISDCWKLKVIDALEIKPSSGILDEERQKIVDMLIASYELRKILSTKNPARDKIEQQQVYSSDIGSVSSGFRGLANKQMIPIQS